MPIGYDPALHTALKAYGEILTVVRNWNTDSGNGIRVSLANDVSNAFTVIGENVAVTEADPTLTGFTSYTDTLTSGLIRVSNQLIEDSAFSIEQFLSDSIAQRYYRGASNMVISGNSSNIASIVTGASVGFTEPVGGTTSISYAALVALYASLDPAYIPNSNFVMNSTTWAELMNVTDLQQRPLLQSDTNGAPFRSLFGRNILMAQALPNPAASDSPILFGSFSDGYTYRTAGQMVVRKLAERYAEFNETGFVFKNLEAHIKIFTRALRCAFLLLAPALSYGQMTQITATGLKIGSNLITTGTVCATAVDANNNPVNVAVSGGGM